MNNYNDTFTSNANKSLIPTEYLPSIFRLLSINHKVLADDLYMHTAEIFHGDKRMNVAWINDERHQSLTVGMLVMPTWSSKLISNVGQVLIESLDPNTQPTADFNIFETVPREWVLVPAIIKYAISSFADLPPEFRLLFNAIFWQSDRFYRYLITPNSMNSHYHWHHGNIMNAIVVAKSAKAMAKSRPQESIAVMTLAALLKDAGKADDYILNDSGEKFMPSARMALVGSTITIIEWIGAAIAKYDISMSMEQYLLLLHALTAKTDCYSPALENGVRFERAILTKAQAFSTAYANIHKRPKYIDQGIKIPIDAYYFLNVD